MNFDLTPEQARAVEAARSIELPSDPKELAARLDEAGLLLIGEPLTLALVVEELSARSIQAGLAVRGDGSFGVAQLILSAHAVGVARAGFELAASDLRARRAEPGAGELQLQTFALADMATEIDAARLLVHRAALALHDEVARGPAMAIAQMFAKEAAVKVTLAASRVLGRAGARAIDPLDRAAREADLEGMAGDRIRVYLGGLETRSPT